MSGRADGGGGTSFPALCRPRRGSDAAVRSATRLPAAAPQYAVIHFASNLKQLEQSFAFGRNIAPEEPYENYESSRNFGRSCQNLLPYFPDTYPLNTFSESRPTRFLEPQNPGGYSKPNGQTGVHPALGAIRLVTIDSHVPRYGHSPDPLPPNQVLNSSASGHNSTSGSSALLRSPKVLKNSQLSKDSVGTTAVRRQTPHPFVRCPLTPSRRLIGTGAVT